MTKTKNIILISLFVSLLCVSGLFLKITFIPPVPFTMLSFFVILGSALLGAKRGVLGCLIYIFMGTVCYLPVFTKGGGLWYVLEPTFGYILALPFAAFLNCFLIKKYEDFRNNKSKNPQTPRGNVLNGLKDKTVISVIFLLPEIIILAVGTLYAYMVYYFTTVGVKDLWYFILSFSILFIPAEILKAILASIAYRQLKRVNLFSDN